MHVRIAWLGAPLCRSLVPSQQDRDDNVHVSVSCIRTGAFGTNTRLRLRKQRYALGRVFCTLASVLASPSLSCCRAQWSLNSPHALVAPSARFDTEHCGGPSARCEFVRSGISSFGAAHGLAEAETCRVYRPLTMNTVCLSPQLCSSTLPCAQPAPSSTRALAALT